MRTWSPGKKIAVPALLLIGVVCGVYAHAVLSRPITYTRGEKVIAKEGILLRNPFRPIVYERTVEAVIATTSGIAQTSSGNDPTPASDRTDTPAEIPHNSVPNENPHLPPESVRVTHVDDPIVTKALYMTSWIAGVPSRRESLMRFIDQTELNAVVIDVKDYSGRISFNVSDPKLVAEGSVEVRIPDIRTFIAQLHKRNIYVIGRISVFQDPYYAQRHPEFAVRRASDGTVWRDHKGIAWLDPGAREVWKYVAAIGKEAYRIGFDELNFDYIRFPSDGDMRDISYPYSNGREKREVLKEFYAYLEDQLRPTGAILSADLFGMTTTNTDDLNIGQILEDAAAHFDYIAPMVYPSHYPSGFNGYADPNKHPYDIVFYSMSSAVTRLRAASTTPHAYHGTVTFHQLRPWLQDFDYGGVYGEREVREQKRAVYAAGLTGWMIWDPANRYTRSAFETERR